MSIPKETRRYGFVARFTMTPGGRLRKDGRYSGEEFREDVLVPSMKAGVGLDIDMTGAIGVGSSFIDEAFGRLAAKIGRATFDAFFSVKSASNPFLRGDVQEALESAVKA